MPICIVWKRSGLGMFLAIQEIGRIMFNPCSILNDKSLASAAVVLA
jgi:hypothetical protein